MNNEFLVYPLIGILPFIHPRRNVNLIIGLVLGLGFPVVVGGIMAYGLRRLRRKGAERQAAKVRLECLKNNIRIVAQET